MRLVLRLMALVLLVAGTQLAVPAQVACACSCAELTTKQAVANAAAVFDGDVLDRRPTDPGPFGDQVAYTIAVTKVYKGDVPRRVQVVTNASGASCGAELKGQVTVFANGRGEDLTTSLCSAPMVLKKAKLGEGHAPARTLVPPSARPTLASVQPPPAPIRAVPPSPDVPALALWSAAGAAAVAVLAVWLIRRTRS